jgi:DNA-directed RNA polymerase subunit RPC12/RpoP
MIALCPKCKAELESNWIFCPHCGDACAREKHLAPASEHVPARGAFGGMVYGLIAAPILIIAGIMLSLTGWGIVLGMPIILLGILAPLAGPLFGMGEHKGKCPQCGTVVLTLADGKVHGCPMCSQAFAIDDRGVVRAG